MDPGVSSSSGAPTISASTTSTLIQKARCRRRPVRVGQHDRVVPLEPAALGRLRTPTDGCRRYRVCAVTFDTRPYVLGLPIEDHWDDHVKEMWHSNKRLVREGVLLEFGVEAYERKLEDFEAIGAAPWSVVAAHNQTLAAIRRAFVAGAYYPALVGAAGLGERILNQIILELRGDFAAAASSQRVLKKRAFDDWKLMVDVLESWNVMPADVAQRYERLRRLRNDTVHYNLPALDASARDEALEAVSLLQKIIERLFHPDQSAHLIPGIDGVEFLRLDVEELPFVRRFFLPASVLVSPEHEWVSNDPLTVLDNPGYGDEEGIRSLTDGEFAHRFARRDTG